MGSICAKSRVYPTEDKDESNEDHKQEESGAFPETLRAEHQAETKGDHIEVESISGETEIMSEQPETVLKMLSAEHQDESNKDHKQVESGAYSETLRAVHQGEIKDDHKEVENAGGEKVIMSEQPETVLKMLTAGHQAEIRDEQPENVLKTSTAEHQGTKMKETEESSSCDCNGKPPQLCFKLPKTSDLPNTFIDWSNAQLPVDVLLLTVEDCDFLSCYLYLEKAFKSYHKVIGPVYFGNIGTGEQEKLKIALIKCSKGSVVPSGSLTVVKNAVSVLGPKAVISVGTCHGLNSEIIKIGDIVVSAKLTTPAFRTPVSRNVGNLIRHASDGWTAPLENPDEQEVRVHCDANVLCLQEHVTPEEIFNQFPSAVALEAEGEGLFAAAYDDKMEWLIVKGVASDRDLSQSVSDDWKYFASTMAASLVANLLSNPIVFKEWPHHNEETTDQNVEKLKMEKENMMDREKCKNEDGFEAEYIEPIRQLYRTDVGCLALFPWCEGEFYFSLEQIFTRLIMRKKDKKRGTLTKKIVQMSAIFEPHEEGTSPRIILIEGDPGMGKTTYCNKLAFDWATGKAGGRFLEFKVVLLIRCCDINSNLQDAISTQVLPLELKQQEREKFFDFIKHNQSDILLVLDGMDELPSGKLPELLEIIQGRSTIFHGCPLVVTARHEAGVKVIKYCDTLLEIEGFTAADAIQFIKKFFKGNGEQGAKMAQKLLNKLNEDKSLTELIANPLNTALLCLLCEYSEGKLPESKTNLYREIVEDVLRRYKKKKNLPETSKDVIEEHKSQLKQLGLIAWKALLETKKFLDKNQLGSHTDLPGFGFLSWQRGSSKRKPCPQYSFLHKSFQEWFASFYLCFQLMCGETSPGDLAADERYFSEHADLKQVLLFTCGILAQESEDKATALIQSLAAHIDKGDESLEALKEKTEKFVVAVECIKECKKEGSNFHLDLARTFGKLLTVQIVSVFWRNFGYVECDVVAKMLTENTTVTYLNLSHNKLDSKCADKICEGLCNNNTLTVLNLSDNKLDSKCADKICEGLCNNNSLTELNLSYNKLDSKCADKICEGLCNNNTLEYLNLSHNKLDSECADKICEGLCINNTLDYLNLSGNKLDSEGADKICEGLCNNSTLRILDLSHNKLGSECADKICEGLCNNNTLKWLDLSHNKLDSECADKICEGLCNNNTLTHLNLSHNNISDPVRNKLKAAHGDRIWI